MVLVVQIAIALGMCYLIYTLWRDFCIRKVPLPLVGAVGLTILLLDIAILVMDTPLRGWILLQPWAATVYAVEPLVFPVVSVSTLAVALVLWMHR
jgi:hypothetical protein